MEDSRLFKLKVVTPERVFFEDMVTMVELRTTEGDMGILKGHIPLTAVVSPGTMKIYKDEQCQEAALLEGIIRIMQEDVVVLAQSCEWPDEIDLARANEAKVRAERRLKGADGQVNLSRAEMALRKALVRIEVAGK